MTEYRRSNVEIIEIPDFHGDIPAFLKSKLSETEVALLVAIAKSEQNTDWANARIVRAFELIRALDETIIARGEDLTKLKELPDSLKKLEERQKKLDDNWLVLSTKVGLGATAIVFVFMNIIPYVWKILHAP